MARLIEALLRLEPARLEADYRSREAPRDYAEPPLAVRLDGVNFGTVLSDLPGPRNRGVHNALKIAAADLASSSGADLAYVVSDEVNLIYRAMLPYRGRVLKLISVLASSLSARASALLNRPLRFDARAIKLYDDRDAARYIAYRARVGLNNYAISIARLRGLVESSTPPIGEILKSLEGEDLSLGWGTLLAKEKRWLEVDLCEFLAIYGLCL
ncbi:MAG: tRNA(His) guanylyltransferase Thg1 family protein [Thermoproteus sp.]